MGAVCGLETRGGEGEGVRVLTMCVFGSLLLTMMLSSACWTDVGN